MQQERSMFIDVPQNNNNKKMFITFSRCFQFKLIIIQKLKHKRLHILPYREDILRVCVCAQKENKAVRNRIESASLRGSSVTNIYLFVRKQIHKI